MRAYECGFFNRKQLEQALEQSERQLQFLGVPADSIDIDLKRGCVRRGRSSAVLKLVEKHAKDESLNLLRCYWMLYQVTENNLVYLCTEAVLPPECKERNYSAVDPKRPEHLLCATETPYFLVTAGESKEEIDAFGISLTSRDASGPMRTFSLHTATPAAVTAKGPQAEEVYNTLEYRRMLQLWTYQLRAAYHQRHETAAYRCDPSTGRPLPDTVFTTRKYEHAILNVQSSTPTWFSAAWQRLQRKIDATDSSSSASTSIASSAHVALDYTSQLITWQPECRMMVLERVFD